MQFATTTQTGARQRVKSQSMCVCVRAFAYTYTHTHRCKADATKSAHENDTWAVLCEEVTKKLNLLWGREFKSDPEQGN